MQSFSKGQVTIPKALRTALGLGDDFVLKLELNEGKIIAEPVIQSRKTYQYPPSEMDLSTVFDMASKTVSGKKLSDAAK